MDTHLECYKDGKDVGHRQQFLSERQDSHHPGDPHDNHERYRHLYPVSVIESYYIVHVCVCVCVCVT